MKGSNEFKVYVEGDVTVIDAKGPEDGFVGRIQTDAIEDLIEALVAAERKSMEDVPVIGH